MVWTWKYALADRGRADSGVKTDWNCILRICALSLGFEWRSPCIFGLVYA